MPNKKNKNELTMLVRKIMECDGTEEEINMCLLDLKESTLHPSVSDLIFFPIKKDITPEEIVDELISYKSLKLGSE